ncbi:hypothetical protein ONZ45_g4355 [Pleurotus djamor]|nr:hypothetical protein ONZ45_g4355 [Pleurotus djamor]
MSVSATNDSQVIPLSYSIYGGSEHSGPYAATHIMVDRPMDQASRWSSLNYASQGDVQQWLLLRLDALSIVKSITFGKYHKAHPCNMKDFEIYVGMTEDHLTKVLEGSLKNDAVPEIFPIQHTNADGVCFPVRFIKIIPLSVHAPNFHTSIWYVAINGIVAEATVEQFRRKYDEYREMSTLRLILKHLRQRRLLTPFQHILQTSGLLFEHPLITDLYNSLVLRGDWEKTEQLLATISEANLYDSYIQSCQPYGVWTRIHGLDADGDKPSPRGGHGMCIDSEMGIIYLHGGWAGDKNLDDFWSYSIKDDRWTLLSPSTSTEKNGPAPCSCHKMVFDRKTGYIYLLGRLNESDNIPHGAAEHVSPTSAPCSEFYRYNTRGIDKGKWYLLTFDTATKGGPPLVADHQMVIDSDAQIIYVFGGRVSGAVPEGGKEPGFYSYNIRLTRWTTLLPKVESSDSSLSMIPPRYGHSMLLDTKNHRLIIFGGKREEKFLSDMYAYDTVKGTVVQLFADSTATGGPGSFFTQRAVMDSELGEIYVFSGYAPQTSGPATVLVESASDWLYRVDYPRPGKWLKILRSSSGRSEGDSAEIPCGRYAHQLVYDTTNRTVYMHGGNAGISIDSSERPLGADADGEDTGGRSRAPDGPGSERKDERRESRLDDFWKMVLRRPEPSEVVRKATYLVRQQQFREMCEKEPSVKALHFLQNDISNVVNHGDPEEAEVFRLLLTHLLSPPTLPVASPSMLASSEGDAEGEGDNGLPPRKRTRSTSPEGTWTNRLDDDEMDGQGTPRTNAITSQSLQANEDPLEPSLRGEADGLTENRFRQRTEVFEALLKFVDAQAKQPDGSLLDMVDCDKSTS